MSNKSLADHYIWRGVEREEALHYKHVFRCIVYVMVFDETKGKFDVKNSKCLFGGYCKDTKAHRLMCLRTNKIWKLEMLCSWRIWKVLGWLWNVSKWKKWSPYDGWSGQSFKTPLFDFGKDIEEHEEKVRDTEVAIWQTREHQQA